MFLGLDLGTSGLKALLTDRDGRVVGTADATYENPHPHHGWSEQNPADWITACESVLDQLKASAPAALADLRGIGLSGHMHGATLVDANGDVLRPCMLWNDTRAAEEAAWLDAQPDMHAITGNIVFPGFTAPKVLWLEKNEPEVFASGVLLAAKESYSPDAASAVHTFCHAVPDRWYQMGVILAATDCLNWLSRQVGQKPAALIGLLPEEINGPSDLLFLPYLSGERTPHNDANVRGAFIGLDVGHTPADLTQAVVEGVSFALRDCLAALNGTGTQLQSVLAMGGGTRSAYWRETLATVLNLPLQVPADGEFGGALGAARLAMAAATGDDPASIMTPPPVGSVVEPRSELTEAYAERWNRYRALYPALQQGLA